MKEALTPLSRLKRTAADAKRAGNSDKLAWFVEMKVSPTITGGKGHTVAACSFPVGWTPIIPVGPDPDLSLHYAQVLMECLKDANRGRLIEFGLALTSKDVIDSGGFNTYEWGEQRWDCICVNCGAVWQSTSAGEKVCEECRQWQSRY